MFFQNQDTSSLDTVCRLYEVGRQKLAEEGDDEVRRMVVTEFQEKLSQVFVFSLDWN